MEVPYQTEVHRMQHHQALLGVPQVYSEIQDSFEHIFARRPADPVVPYCADDADTLIVSMGTIGATAERVVDLMRAQDRRIGSLRVRLFRPLPVELIRRWFAGKKRIAVIDRNISLGFGGVLWGEVRALADPDAIVQNYMAGIGGGDVRPEHIEKLLVDLEQRQSSGVPVMMEAL
jgi:pyruvate/2-oxoacid:ferredoxin oxidoreductase alpha subunit